MLALHVNIKGHTRKYAKAHYSKQPFFLKSHRYSKYMQLTNGTKGHWWSSNDKNHFSRMTST